MIVFAMNSWGNWNGNGFWLNWVFGNLRESKEIHGNSQRAVKFIQKVPTACGTDMIRKSRKNIQYIRYQADILEYIHEPIYLFSNRASSKKVSELMHQFYTVKRNSGDGQGLVEYSIILALLALVVVTVLVVFGPGVGNIFSESSKAFNMEGGEPEEQPTEEPSDEITISQVDYYNGNNVHIDAQVDGGSDPSVTLTASPGGVMQIVDLHYHILFSLPGCPCEVTITSSAGDSTTVMVGP